MAVSVQNMASLLAPIAFASAVADAGSKFYRRWRDPQASKLEKAVAAIKACPPDPARALQNAEDLQKASNALEDYKGET